MKTVEYTPQLKEPKDFQTLISEVPEAISFAKIEAESSKMAKTPEGTFVLTYLLAARNLLRPVLTEAHLHRDLLQQTGGYDYNPTRNIDDVGTAIAFTLAKDTQEPPNLWIHTEEDGLWRPAHTNNGFWEDATRFAVLDSLDMTSSISHGDRVQTTGMSIYTKEGNLLSTGIMSLVDDQFIFVDKSINGFSIHSNIEPSPEATDMYRPIRYAAKTRRMYTLNNTPIVQYGHSRTLDCDSGYAVLELHKGAIDTIIDHVRGNPWYEVAIWVRVAQAMGYPVTDASGNPIDISKVIQRTIQHDETGAYRIPFVISRTPEIHEKILGMLQSDT